MNPELTYQVIESSYLLFLDEISNTIRCGLIDNYGYLRLILSTRICTSIRHREITDHFNLLKDYQKSVDFELKSIYELRFA